MALTWLQFTTGIQDGFTGTVTTGNFGLSVTVNNLIIVGISSEGSTNDVVSVTDNKGNTYHQAAQRTNGSFQDLEIWYAVVITGGAGLNITVTNNSAGRLALEAEEWSGAATSGLVDISQSNTGTGSGNLTTGASPSTTNNNDIIYAVGSVGLGGVTWTTGAGYSNRVDFNNASGLSSSAESKTVSTTGSQTATLTSDITNQNWDMLLVAFSDTPIIASTLNITVSDSSSTSEAMTILRSNARDINVSDTVSKSESLKFLITSGVNISETATASETVSLVQSLVVNVNDTVTVDENVVASLPSYAINVSDTSSTSENTTVLEPFYLISVSDAVGTSESIQFQPIKTIGVSDTVITAENIGINLPLTVSVSDTVAISENTVFLDTAFINVLDNILGNESVVSVIPASDTLSITVSDDAPTGEYVEIVESILIISVSDSISLSETVFFGKDVLVAVSDSVAFIESITMNTGMNIMRSSSFILTVPASLSFKVIKKDS